LALVLGLPLEPLKPLREFLVPVVFGVVLISLLLQGLTIPALIGAVDVAEDEADADVPEQED
jgi:CPA1 family monovalent cation:H+ antiporter